MKHQRSIPCRGSQRLSLRRFITTFESYWLAGWPFLSMGQMGLLVRYATSPRIRLLTFSKRDFERYKTLLPAMFSKQSMCTFLGSAHDFKAKSKLRGVQVQLGCHKNPHSFNGARMQLCLGSYCAPAPPWICGGGAMPHVPDHDASDSSSSALAGGKMGHSHCNVLPEAS